MYQGTIIEPMTRRVLIFVAALCLVASAAENRWTTQKANDWYAKQPWLVGANFLPSNAINELEMWQASTWSPELIDKELGWAQSLGMNTMRVFLHDLAYRTDPAGFKKRLEEFLKISSKHGIRPMLVLFDSCWDPYPKAGKQKDPTPGLHNSGWVQSPGREILEDVSKWPMLRSYVKDLVGSFRNDKRILAWDVVNEPDNDNANSYGRNNLKQEPANKAALGVQLTREAFGWVREAKPSQPVTSGPWNGDWSSLDKMNELNKFLVENSDIITFHNYENAALFEKRVKMLQQFGRPLLCTEYMARVTGSTFQNILPVAKQNKIAMINWGFVSGKSQTIFPWDSWQKPYQGEPPVWFHDIFRTNGEPYKPEETQFIKQMTGRSK
jgi:hypothetical protein